MFFEKGKKYVVTSNLNNHFTPGDVVVSLENATCCACCCFEDEQQDIDSPTSLDGYFCLTRDEVITFEEFRDNCERLMLDKMRDIVNIAKMYDPTTDYLNVSFCNGMLSVNNDYWENHRMIERREVFEDDK